VVALGTACTVPAAAPELARATHPRAIAVSKRASCDLPLPATTEPTEAQLLALILPRWRPGVGLPATAAPHGPFEEPTEPYMVEPCVGPQITTLEPPRVGRVERLRLDEGRELVWFAVGTQAGMVGYTVGIAGLLARQPGTLRLLSVQTQTAGLESGLAPYRRATFGAEAVLLQTTTTGPENEDYAGGTSVSVYRVSEDGLKWLGVMIEAEASHPVFWRGLFDYVMTSSGPLAEATGFVVREEWAFINRATHARTTRALERHYTLSGEQVVASPPNDRNAWPETSMRGAAGPLEPTP
jgi:hypothetical protein